MKTLIRLSLLFCFVFFSHLSSSAQIELGIYTGINNGSIATIGSDVLPHVNGISSAIIGGHVGYSLDRKFSVEAGVSYMKKGANISAGTGIDILGLELPIGVKAETATNTIDIPLRLKYKMGNEKYGVYFAAGPQLNISTGGTLKTYATTIVDIVLTDRALDFNTDNIRRSTLGGQIGLGGEIMYSQGKFFGELTYKKDFSEFMIEEAINTGIAHKGTMIKLGYAISF